ncbi:FG-GAP repeat domain-containing protein [Pontiella sp.]|uniref:FG-GAP repeat domain-containing protein n=1 Tax=Pontiella sp. TaxID=2837462 RepID=UPI003569CE87
MSKFALLLTGVAIASAAAAEVPQRDFGFRPLEIHTFKHGTTRLIVTDLNNDGLDDLLFANNHVSRLEILMRKPGAKSLGDLPELKECFEDRGMIVDQGLKALRVGDLDGDGLKDLVTFGTSIGLQLRYQRADGSFKTPERIFAKDLADVTTIQLGDLNGDGRLDILLCRHDKADLLWNAPAKPFTEKKTLTFAADKSFFGDIADINNDGIPDLAFHFNSASNPLKIRFGKGGGLFGIEQPLDLPPRHYMDILQGEGAEPQIGMVLRNRLAFRTYGFTRKELPALLAAQEASPGRIGLEGTNLKSSPAWIAHDFDNDGFDDLLVAAPELSRLHLYSGAAEGLDPEPKRIDTLSEVVRLSRMPNGDVMVVSKKEKIAAVHSAADLERFPTILKTPGNVLAGCQDWLICKNDEKQLLLTRMEQDGHQPASYPLDMKNDPDDLLAFALPEGKTGLIFFMPYDVPKMMVFADGTLEEITSESFRALTQRLSLSNIRLGNADDGSSLVVSQGALARRFEWKGDRYEATRQFNPENPRGELIASCGYGLLDGASGNLFYDRNSGDLVHFAADGDDWGKIHIADANQTIFDLVQLRNPERDVVVLIDRGGLNTIVGNGSSLDVVPTGEHVSPSENALLAFAKLVRLGSPARPKIALIDPSNRAVEILDQENGALEMQLAFEVFLTSSFADTGKNRGTEPHDIESGDLNGDGIGDLVVLAHDKLLIYLGE